MEVATARQQSFSKEYVKDSLEFAGQSLLSLKIRAPGPSGMRSFWPDIVGNELEDLPAGVKNRATMPTSRQIDAMDEILAWISLIPQERVEIRRTVGFRALLSPVSDKYLYPWARIAKKLSCDPRTVKSWHEIGLGLITRELNTKPILARMCVSAREIY